MFTVRCRKPATFHMSQDNGYSMAWVCAEHAPLNPNAVLDPSPINATCDHWVTTDTLSETRNVPERWIDDIRSKFDKLVRKAAKVGAEIPTLTLGEPFTVSRPRDGDELSILPPILEIHVPVTVTAKAIVLPGGWRLLGTICPTTEGNILDVVPGVVIPTEYRNRDGQLCDHCRTRRMRNETHLVQSETGEIKQVGSSCVSDFLGNGFNPDSLLAYGRALAGFMGETESYGRGEDVPSLALVLTWGAYSSRIEGYRSKKAAYIENRESTADDVRRHLNPPTMGESARHYREYITRNGMPTDADKALGETVAAWVLGLSDAAIEGNDYLANLRVIARLGAVRSRFMGYAVSMLGAYKRAIEGEAQRLAKTASVHVGTVGKRETFTLTVTRTATSEGQYGTTERVEFADPAGNVVIWWASGVTGWRAGETRTVKATVKKHDTYKGIAQTMVNRVAEVG